MVNLEKKKRIDMIIEAYLYTKFYDEDMAKECAPFITQLEKARDYFSEALSTDKKIKDLEKEIKELKEEKEKSEEYADMFLRTSRLVLPEGLTLEDLEMKSKEIITRIG